MPEIPEEVRKTLKFHFVDNIDQVMAEAIGVTPRPVGRQSTRGQSTREQSTGGRPAAKGRLARQTTAHASRSGNHSGGEGS